MNSNDLADCVRRTLKRYFRDLEGERAQDVHAMVIANVECAMLEIVMEQTAGNQTLAAEVLGINRNTLRRKLTEYQLL